MYILFQHALYGKAVPLSTPYSSLILSLATISFVGYNYWWSVFYIYSTTLSQTINDRGVRGIMISVDLELLRNSASPIVWDILDLPHLTSVVSESLMFRVRGFCLSPPPMSHSGSLTSHHLTFPNHCPAP